MVQAHQCTYVRLGWSMIKTIIMMIVCDSVDNHGDISDDDDDNEKDNDNGIQKQP